MNQHIAIFSATSAIAEELGRRYATRSASISLIARDADNCARIADDLRIRGANQVASFSLDLEADEDWAQTLDAVFANGGPDVVLICAGSLPDQAKAWSELDYLRRHFELNATAQIALITAIAKRMSHGSLVIVSSVAGDRGRAINAIYGAAKAALTAYSSALRQARPDLHVLTVKPGIVISPMTANIEHGPLSSTPQLVAKQIDTAIARKRLTLYTPRRWWLIMLIIRCLPEALFRKLKF